MHLPRVKFRELFIKYRRRLSTGAVAREAPKLFPRPLQPVVNWRMPPSLSSEMGKSEWLEADGLGGFASGTVSGIRTRRYHALLLVATTPPAGRIALVKGFDAEVETDAGRIALTTQRYAPGLEHPHGVT